MNRFARRIVERVRAHVHAKIVSSDDREGRVSERAGLAEQEAEQIQNELQRQLAHIKTVLGKNR